MPTTGRAPGMQHRIPQQWSNRATALMVAGKNKWSKENWLSLLWREIDEQRTNPRSQPPAPTPTLHRPVCCCCLCVASCFRLLSPLPASPCAALLCSNLLCSLFPRAPPPPPAEPPLLLFHRSPSPPMSSLPSTPAAAAAAAAAPLSPEDAADVAVLESTLFRFASTEDDKLEATLTRVLPKILPLFLRPSLPIRDGLMLICNHVFKRLKAMPTMRLPVAELLALYKAHATEEAAQAGFFVSFTLSFIEKGFARMDAKERVKLAHELLPGLAMRAPPQQKTLLHTFFKCLAPSDYQMERVPAEELSARWSSLRASPADQQVTAQSHTDRSSCLRIAPPFVDRAPADCADWFACCVVLCCVSNRAADARCCWPSPWTCCCGRPCMCRRHHACPQPWLQQHLRRRSNPSRFQMDSAPPLSLCSRWTARSHPPLCKR